MQNDFDCYFSHSFFGHYVNNFAALIKQPSIAYLSAFTVNSDLICNHADKAFSHGSRHTFCCGSRIGLAFFSHDETPARSSTEGDDNIILRYSFAAHCATFMLN